MSVDPNTTRKENHVLLRGVALCKRYMQRAPFSRRKFTVDAVNNVDLEIQTGQITALVGESGSGKSTLASCLALLEKPDSGQIFVEDQPVTGWSARQLLALRPRIQMVFQDSAGALNPRFSAARVIQEPLEVQGLSPGSELRQRACSLMEEVGLSPDRAEASPLEFSGGQRQRLAIARALALKPALLIFDESLSGLDLVTQAEIMNLLLDLQGRHELTYVLISHDLSMIGQVADYIAVMQRGMVVERGSREQVFKRPQHEHTRELLSFARGLEVAFHSAGAEAQG